MTGHRIVKKGIVENKAVAIHQVANDTQNRVEELYDFDVKVHRRMTKRELVIFACNILDYFKSPYTTRHNRLKRHEWYLKNMEKVKARQRAWDRAHPEAKKARNKRYRQRHKQR